MFREAYSFAANSNVTPLRLRTILLIARGDALSATGLSAAVPLGRATGKSRRGGIEKLAIAAGPRERISAKENVESRPVRARMRKTPNTDKSRTPLRRKRRG